MVPRRLFSRMRAAAPLGPDPTDVRQSLVALAVSLVASLVAGLVLASITDTLEELPGLLVLVPAAIGLRGTIFGTLGSRLGTAIHSGTFRLGTRVDSVIGQNVLAATVLTLTTSVALAVLAKAVSVVFGVAEAISLADFVVISLVGGVLSSVVVLVLTVVLAEVAARREWDPDNVMAPLVTAGGDMVTLPALWLATFLVGPGLAVTLGAAIGATLSIAALVAVLRSRYRLAARVLQESVPVALVVVLVGLFAGLILEGRLSELAGDPALLILVPPFLGGAGAIGGILSSRLASKLHLGVIEPAALPPRGARPDIARAFGLAIPMFALSAMLADFAARTLDLDSPGVWSMVAVALLGGLVATAVAVLVAYYASVVGYRLGLDPDNLGIPLVTATLDLVGSAAFVLAIVLVGAT